MIEGLEGVDQELRELIDDINDKLVESIGGQQIHMPQPPAKKPKKKKA